ncbi:MAG: hypothetical protein AAF182_04685, partial [Pseudomonadota bacterium]
MTLLRAKSSSSLALLCAASVLLSGCGMKWPEWAVIDYDPLGGLSAQDRALAPEPPTLEPITAPTHAYGDPVSTTKPVQLKPDGSMGSFGLNLDTYIRDDGGDVEERIERLERTVMAMHRDLKLIVPKLQEAGMQKQQPIPQIEHDMDTKAPVMLVPKDSMPDIEDDDALYDEEIVEEDIGSEGVAEDSPKVALNELMAETKAEKADVIEKAQDLPDAPPSKNKTPVDKGPRDVGRTNGAVITGVRVGEHADKVRIVFDTTAKTPFSADLDNGEKLLVVEVPEAGATLPANKSSFGKLPVLKSYSVSDTNGGQGHIFVMQLKSATQILGQKSFPALSGGGERLVIDLKATQAALT